MAQSRPRNQESIISSCRRTNCLHDSERRMVYTESDLFRIQGNKIRWPISDSALDGTRSGYHARATCSVRLETDTRTYLEFATQVIVRPRRLESTGRTRGYSTFEQASSTSPEVRTAAVMKKPSSVSWRLVRAVRVWAGGSARSLPAAMHVKICIA